MKHEPTEEQKNLRYTILDGEHTLIEAFAGASKTTSLIYSSEALKGEKGRYLAFNSSIAKAAATEFPKWVMCQTTHSLAFHAVGKKYVNQGRELPGRDVRRLRSHEVATILGIKDGYQGKTARVTRNSMAYMALQTVTRFCYSADDRIGFQHFPWTIKMNLWDEAELNEIKALVVHYAEIAWKDINKFDGKLNYQHDYYLKQFQLTYPHIDADFIMIDEGQDTNPATLDIFVNQGDHAQLIMVGDSYQQIYAWRGAVDALNQFDAPSRCFLTKSFRFGEAVAFEANKWLRLLGCEQTLVGFEKIPSVVKALTDPHAILCRTNAQVIAETLGCQEEDKKVYVQGGTKEIKEFAEAARDLMAGNQVQHPELIGFDNWDEVVDYAAADESAKDLRVFVKLVADYGVEKILSIASTTVQKEQYADVVVSTAHKAKGREWDSVRIAPDFSPPEPDSVTGESGLNDSELKLAYVAITRAKLELDCTNLDWVNDWTARLNNGDPNIGTRLPMHTKEA